MPTASGHNPTPDQLLAGQRTGQTTQARAAKQSKLSQLLDAQDVMMKDMTNVKLSTRERCDATRAWDIIEERIRILRGKTKAGSRNISVREPHPSELKRLKSPPVQAHSSLYDYAHEQSAPASPIVPPPPEPQA